MSLGYACGKLVSAEGSCLSFLFHYGGSALKKVHAFQEKPGKSAVMMAEDTGEKCMYVYLISRCL